MLKTRTKIYKLSALVLCLFLIGTVIAGCTTKKDEGTTTSTTSAGTTKAGTTEPTEVKKPSVLEITRELYFGDVSDNPEMKKEFMEEFEKKFGIKLKVNYYPKNEYMTKVNLAVTSGEIQGIVSIYGPISNAIKYRDDGVILPLDDFLKDNENWKKWDIEYKSLKESYKLPDDGKTWALPMGYAYNFFDRAVRKDWLDKLNLPVPETLDDLKVVAKAFTENDPDGNGKKDTFGLVSANMWNLQDIFMAYGCNLDNVGGGSITFDKEKMAWVDNMLNPEMPNALAYLKDLYLNGYLDPETFVNKGAQMRQKFYNGIAGSWFYWWNSGYSAENTIRQVQPNAEVIEIPALKGKKQTNINHYAANGAPWVLLKNTKEAKEMINWFVNIFYANEEAYWWLRYGTDKYNIYDLPNKRIIRVVDPNSPTKAGYPAPGLQGDLPWFTQNDYLITTGDDPELVEKAKFNLERKMKVFNDGKKLNLLYEKEFKYDAPISETYSAISADITKAFDECVFNAITGKTSIEQAIETYKNTVKALGAQKVIDEASATLGLQPQFKY